MPSVRTGLAVAIALVACNTAEPVGVDAFVEPPPTGEFVGLPSGLEQWQNVCAKHYGDAVSAKFCAYSKPPWLSSLDDLEVILGLRMENHPAKLVMTGLSTGVGVRTVTPLNPRAVLMTAPKRYDEPNPSYTVLSFARGEPLVELVANDPSANTLRFFVLRFHPACESTPEGCNWADLLTPTIESGWTSYTLYDDDTLKNTTLDCLSCHQPGGPGTPKILRMQELLPGWTHWFGGGASGTSDVSGAPDFHAAHHREKYAGYPSDYFESLEAGQPYVSDAAELMNLVMGNGFGTQPNMFISGQIDFELKTSGTSPTWQALYEKAVAGQEIPPPYYGPVQTDPNKVAPMISAYQGVMDGSLARELLPDIRDTLLDSALPYMSLRPKPGLDGRGILVHMCGRCHNSRLDQSLTRARFNVETLDMMSRDEKQKAIGRLQLPDDDQKKMPPPRFHMLSPEERDLAISELSK